MSDTVSAQRSFVEKQKLPFELLADVKGALSSASEFRIGKVRLRQLISCTEVVWKDEKASVGSQGEDLLEALEALEE